MRRNALYITLVEVLTRLEEGSIAPLDFAMLHRIPHLLVLALTISIYELAVSVIDSYMDVPKSFAYAEAFDRNIKEVQK